MPSIVPGFEYDIFISYRHNDNRSGWVTDFVNALQEELAATIKEPLSIYFDKNPHDGLLETHDVDGSLKEKLKCLIFIPIVSRTYCDTKSFAWNHEFLEFIKTAPADSFGLKIKLPNGNIASRALPIRTHELDSNDRQLIEKELGPLRTIDFTYQAAGVNRPLRLKDDESIKGTNQTSYRDQINKTANAIGDLIAGMQGKTQPSVAFKDEEKQSFTTQSKRKKQYRLPQLRVSTGLILALCVALTAISVIHFTEKVQPVKTYKTSILAELGFKINLGTIGSFALSPDGNTVAYVAIDSSNKQFLWVRHLNNLHGIKLSDTEGAYLPFWSPDSKHIGFFSGGKLKRVPIEGGPAHTLCEIITGRGGSWNENGIILFSAGPNNTISKLSANGGKPVSVTSFDSTRKEVSHRWPHYLPDGKHFFYTARAELSITTQRDAIILASTDSTFTPRVITMGSANAEYANGYLFFVKGQTLLTQSFNIDDFELTGDAFQLAENVYYEGTTNYCSYSISKTGILLYHSSPPRAVTNSLVWYDRQGNELGKLYNGSSGNYLNIRFSPDNKKIAFAYYESAVNNQDIWLYDRPTNVWTRFTFDKATDRGPAWSPDGKRLVFSSNRNKNWDLYERSATGEGTEKFLMNGVNFPYDWSRDGKHLLSWQSNPNSTGDIWVYDMQNKASKPAAFFESEFEDNQAYFSPDGKWIAYRSNESGKGEIYIRPFPGPGGKWQVSVSGGSRPHWRGDGKELFFLSDDFKIMSAEIRLGSGQVEIGNVKPLFAIRPISVPLSRDIYNVTSDGQKFLVEAFLVNETSPPLTLVTNWPGELGKN